MMNKKKLAIASLALLSLSLTPSAQAMGSGDSYLDAQTGLTYQVLKPTNTKDLLLNSFKLTPCKGSPEAIIQAKYGEDRSIQIQISPLKVKCGPTQGGRTVASTTINGSPGKITVLCPKTLSSKRCSTSDLQNYGGSLTWSTKGNKIYKGSQIILTTSGISYKDLLLIARSMK